jgi:prefoldin subunit 5
VSEPEDKVVPLLPAQLVRVERSIDEALENLRAQRDELSLVIAKLSDGLAVIDQASTAQATDQVRKLIELLAVAQSRLDELSVGIERLERNF